MDPDFRKPAALVRVALTAFLIAWMGCGLLQPKADYAADVAICEAAPTCAAFVECRLMAAEKHHRPPEVVGTCVPNSDGGLTHDR